MPSILVGSILGIGWGLQCSQPRPIRNCLSQDTLPFPSHRTRDSDGTRSRMLCITGTRHAPTARGTRSSRSFQSTPLGCRFLPCGPLLCPWLKSHNFAPSDGKVGLPFPFAPGQLLSEFTTLLPLLPGEIRSDVCKCYSTGHDGGGQRPFSRHQIWSQHSPE